MYHDTIVAQLTSYGKSSVGILRISGKYAKDVAYKALGQLPFPKFAYYTKFFNIDFGIAIWFPKPFSFTGEDILELHCHGNPVILDLLIKEILLIKNIRLANPGEFSERAFLNGKIDLIQAESIMDLINASSEASIKSSLRSLQGDFSKKINILINKIIKLRILLEALINFPEDDINLSEKKIKKELNNIFLDIFNIYKIANTGNIIREGIKVVIVGQPNSGKSSLFNALLLNESAIVTNIKGTTRDLLHENLLIDGILFQLTDTAGLHETNNFIEILGINKTKEQIKLADHIILMIDDTINIIEKNKIISNFVSRFPIDKKITILFNKSDLSRRKSGIIKKYNQLSYISISAKKGFGIKIFKEYLKKETLGLNYHSEETFLSRRRHINILKKSIKYIKKIKKEWMFFNNIECIAEDLKLIQNILGEITGFVTSEKILNSIFSDFCIGK